MLLYLQRLLKNKYMNSEPLPITKKEVYVPYKGSIAKWELSNELDADGRQIAIGATENTEDGTVIQPFKSLHETSLNGVLQEALRARYIKEQQILGHGALDIAGVEQPISESTNYDNMFNPDYEMPHNTEFAAVRPLITDDERRNRERTSSDMNSAANLYSARRKDGIR